MAYLSKAGVEKLLSRIIESGGFTDTMLKDVERLKAELDERDGMLKKYGEFYDGENEDELIFKEKTFDGDTTDYKDKYIDLKKRYLDRFFNRVKEDVMEETVEDIKRDSTPQSIDELWDNREGDSK